MSTPTTSRHSSLASTLRFILIETRWTALILLGAAAVTTYLISLTTPDMPPEQWLMLEGFYIPFGTLIVTTTFISKYERNELELLLARRSARSLFLHTAIPGTAILILIAAGLSLIMPTGGPLEATARVLLLTGTTHLIMNASRSQWLGLISLGLWWLVSLAFMVPWAESAPDYQLILHPLRLSGGGDIRPSLEIISAITGLLLLTAAWLSIGRDNRWLR